MIYITGDTHGERDFLKMLSPELSRLTKKDYVIVCGDIGVLFDEKISPYFINLYSYLPYTVLFVDGNHENFDLLCSYPVTRWKGGNVHKISKSVYHLMRGQVFTIEGKKFFTFGGALSFDRDRRVEGKSWWKAEMPTEEDYVEGVKNLERHGGKVDYVLSHDCSTSMMQTLASHSKKLLSEGVIISPSNVFLERYAEKIRFKKWFFGHFHIDEEWGNYRCVFHDFVKIGK